MNTRSDKEHQCYLPNAGAFIKQEYKAALDMEKEMPGLFLLMKKMNEKIALPGNKEEIQENNFTLTKAEMNTKL